MNGIQIETFGNPAEVVHAESVIRPHIDLTRSHEGGIDRQARRAVLFLASGDSSYITGIELFVDGGFAPV